MSVVMFFTIRPSHLGSFRFDCNVLRDSQRRDEKMWVQLDCLPLCHKTTARILLLPVAVVSIVTPRSQEWSFQTLSQPVINSPL